MTRLILTILCALASVFALPPASAGAAGGLPQARFDNALKKTGYARVTQVIDPATLLLKDGRIVRLSGLDFPDYAERQPGPLAQMAMRVLRDMLVGRDVALYQTPKKDTGRINRLGHILAQVERQEDGAWVQGSLLALGLARTATSKTNPQMADDMYALEAFARAEKIGLWEDTQFRVLKPEEAEDHVGKFALVEGSVTAVALRNNRIYLNFGSDWRTDFTISIAAEDKKSFARAGLDPLQWAHEKIRVRGWVQDFNGPLIEADHAEQIETPAHLKSAPGVARSTAKP